MTSKYQERKENRLSRCIIYVNHIFNSAFPTALDRTLGPNPFFGYTTRPGLSAIMGNVNMVVDTAHGTYTVGYYIFMRGFLRCALSTL